MGFSRPSNVSMRRRVIQSNNLVPYLLLFKSKESPLIDLAFSASSRAWMHQSPDSSHPPKARPFIPTPRHPDMPRLIHLISSHLLRHHGRSKRRRPLQTFPFRISFFRISFDRLVMFSPLTQKKYRGCSDHNRPFSTSDHSPPSIS
jgi:hypothetical protein